MSWPAAEGRHYPAAPSRWWYGCAGQGQAGPDKTGDTMNQQGTGYRPARRTNYGSVTGVDHDHRRDYQSAAARGGAGSTPVVSFVNVSKHYGNLKAVDGLSLDLRAGETVALLGPNGAGKSTSLDMLLALRKPTSGKIQMFGSDPYTGV